MSDNVSNPNKHSEDKYDYTRTGQEQFIGLGTTNPLVQAKPVEKAYQNAGISHEAPDVIPEFQFPIGNNSDFEDEFNSPQRAASSPTQEETAFNPHMSELPNKEKRLASEMMAEQIIEGYSFAWAQFLTPLGQFNKKKIEKAIVEGEISASVTVPISDTEEKPIRNFIEDFNESVAESLKVDQEFKDRVREPLIRVLEKKGLGLTDEQVLGLEVGKDFITKTAIILSIRGDIKEITENFKERTLEMKRSAGPVSSPEVSYDNNEKTSQTADPIIEPVVSPIKVVPVNQKELHGSIPGSNPSILADMEKEAAKLAESATSTSESKGPKTRQSTSKNKRQSRTKNQPQK